MSPRLADVLLNRLYKFVLCTLLITFLLLLPRTLPGSSKLQQVNHTQFPESDLEYDDDDDFGMDEKNSRKLAPPKKYFVYTSTCRMDYVDPFELDAIAIFNPEAYRSCAQADDMVSVVYEHATKTYRLQLLGEANQLNSTITCCYQRVKRNAWHMSDNAYSLEHCQPFEDNTTVPNTVEAMIVHCSVNDWTLQQFAFAFIHAQDDAAKRQSAKGGSTKPNATKVKLRKPSVIILGIDSLSRINFRRNMRATYNYLREYHWFELEGFNKVAGNAFGNQMALLTGHSEDEVYRRCDPNAVGGLNKCKFVWDLYKQRGYRTAYAEDLVKFSAFNQHKQGFRSAPTDHYLRPLMVAIDEQLSGFERDPKSFCLGGLHYAEYVFDYAASFTTVYSDVPTFGLFWTNSFTRNAFDGAATMDGRFLRLLRTLEADGVMETSIVVFMSDHGMLHGPLRELSSGFLEERLPVFYISLPKWLQDAQPDFVAALELNRNRLTSTYDVHATLQHILALSRPGRKLPPAQGCAKCQSIFRAVPENRTCADAGIKEHWCTCEIYRSVDVNNRTVEQIAVKIIEQMNGYIEASYPKSSCAMLQLKSINKAEVKEHLAQPDSATYRLQFTAFPKHSIFEVSVRYNLTSKQVALDVQSINEINKYPLSLKCSDNVKIEHFCICALS